MTTPSRDCYDSKFCSDVGRALARHKHYDKLEERRAGARHKTYDKLEEPRAGARPTPPKPGRCGTFAAMARLLANRPGASSFVRFDARVPGAA